MGVAVLGYANLDRSALYHYCTLSCKQISIALDVSNCLNDVDDEAMNTSIWEVTSIDLLQGCGGVGIC